jgi:hypothetical protein
LKGISLSGMTGTDGDGSPVAAEALFAVAIPATPARLVPMNFLRLNVACDFMTDDFILLKYFFVRVS